MILHGKRPFCVLSPLWGLGATYNGRLWLIGKRVVDFLLVLAKLFSLGVTAEVLRANISSKSVISLQRGPVYPKFQVEVVAPINHSSSQKTRLRSFFCFVKMHAFDRKTDRQTDGRTEGWTDSFLLTRPPYFQCSAAIPACG